MLKKCHSMHDNGRGRDKFGPPQTQTHKIRISHIQSTQVFHVNIRAERKDTRKYELFCHA
jgi:hypothetical protein